MVESGELVSVDLPGEPPRYALPGTVHPLIFLCEKTGRAFTLPVGDALAQIDLPDGFEMNSSMVVMRGVAP